ncbi:MAG: LysR family transcriptional regulator [Burkholderiales bacterium]|nr:LysR family transcriptional regulator [Burkholderiales bacterium]
MLIASALCFTSSCAPLRPAARASSRMTKASTLQLDITANLQRWKMFVAVAEEGTLTRAALHLDSNQTALSRHLTALELQCGARLFERTGRGVKLSETGARILPQVRDLLAQAEQLELDIRGKTRPLSGLVTMALMPSVAQNIVGPLFSFLRTHHPGARLRVLEGASGKVEEWLADGRADIGLLYRYHTPLPANETALLATDAYLVGGRGDRATARATVPFHLLADLPLVLPSAPNGLRHAIEVRARAARVTLSPIIESDSLALLKSLAMNEKVNVILSHHALGEDLASGRLQAARIVDPSITATVSIARSKAKAPSSTVELVSRKVTELVQAASLDGALA